MAGRRFGAVGAAAVLLGVAVLSSLAFGSLDVAPATVMEALTSADARDSEHLVVRELRLPRTIAGLAVGAALGLAGAVMQAVTRNPLAEPGLLGINAGAALAVVVGIGVLGLTAPAEYAWTAFAGAALAAALIAMFSARGRGRGSGTPVRLVLAGAVLAALFASLTGAILVMDASTLAVYRFWIVGSLAGASLSSVVTLAPLLGVGAVAAVIGARSLNALSLGEDVARSLGVRVGALRILANVAVVLLAGASVAIAGPIAFIGLAVPHAARLIVGPDWRWILPVSALVGPILLLAADVIGRLVARPSELQVGIVTALVGAPLFILLVRRQRLVEL